jgi:hypothetical protein
MISDLVPVLLAALLAVVPRVPQPQRGRMERHHDAIVTAASEASARYDVPPALLLTLGFLEAHLGADGRGWGAPINRRHRMVDGTPATAASAIAMGFRVCGTWTRAVHLFRCGRCVCRVHLIGYQPAYAIAIAERAMRRAGVPLPDAWRSPQRTALASRHREAGPRR